MSKILRVVIKQFQLIINNENNENNEINYENCDYGFKYINDNDLLKFGNLNFLSHEVASNSFKLKLCNLVTA